MKINIGKIWQKKLAQFPESGMGSQHIDFILKSGRIIPDVTVFNGEDCELEQSFDPNEILDVRPHHQSVSR
jgi:hypothetical protein